MVVYLIVGIFAAFMAATAAAVDLIKRYALLLGCRFNVLEFRFFLGDAIAAGRL
jgi:hypothetical protein